MGLLNPHASPMHQCHAGPSLPVVPDPNPTSPNIAPFELHDTAARGFEFDLILDEQFLFFSLTRFFEMQLFVIDVLYVCMYIHVYAPLSYKS